MTSSEVIKGECDKIIPGMSEKIVTSSKKMNEAPKFEEKKNLRCDTNTMELNEKIVSFLSICQGCQNWQECLNCQNGKNALDCKEYTWRIYCIPFLVFFSIPKSAEYPSLLNI